MSDSLLNGLDWPDASASRDSDGESAEIDQVLRELKELACQDAPEEKLEDIGLGIKLEKKFGKKYGKQFSSDRWHDDRMKVMRALGICLKRCKKVRNLGLGSDISIYDGLNYYLSFPEVEELTRGLEHSPLLKEVEFSRFYFEDEDASACWSRVAAILRSAANLEAFRMDDMEGNCNLVQIAQAVTANLQDLVLRFDEDSVWTEGMLTQLSKTLVAARNLKRLSLGGRSMDKHGAIIFGQAVAMHEVLETLALDLEEDRYTDLEETKDACDGRYLTGTESHEGAVDCLITEAFLGPRPNTSIQRLRLSFHHLDAHRSLVAEWISVGARRKNTNVRMPWLDSLSRLLQRNSSVADLEISAEFCVYLSRDLQTLFEALRANRSLRNFTLEGVSVDTVDRTGRGFDLGAFSVLVDWITSATHLERLDLIFEDSRSDLELDWPAFFKSLACNSNLRSLRLRMPPGHEFPVSVDSIEAAMAIQKEMMEWSRITRLKQLDIDGPFVYWGPLLRSLGANTNLEELKLSSRVLEDAQDFQELMKLLRINSTLKQIDFHYVDSEFKSREAQVREALRHKARQETYLGELGATFGTTRWTHPTCGRLFLCGNPMAGKTQLADTMLRLEAPWYTRVLGKFIPRTQGIEIQALKNDASMQLSLWDLAGQNIFRALQEYVFPKLNKACVFLFVFSLYNRDAEPKALKTNWEVALTEELLYWLKFITSNSELTGFNLPVVKVVLTHKDKTTNMSLEWAVSVLEKLQQEFKNVVTISLSPFCVNGRQKEDVEPILTEVYAEFKDLFEEKLFRVPEACCQVSSFLLDWARKNKKQPVVTYEKFVSLCTAAHPTLQDFLSSHSDEKKMKVIRALASYLHDVGTIVALPDQKIMVVNPNWLTHTFLGSIIGTGKDVELRKKWGKKVKDSERGKSKVAPPTSDNGFLLKSQFERFAKENVLSAMTRKGYCGLDFRILQMLMEGLDLCFEVPNGEGVARVFVPTLFNVEQQPQLRWQREYVRGDVSYLGLRVRCKDQRKTSLSVGFFPQFQISLWRKMIQRESLDSKLIYKCKYNLISILHDGHDVLVENEEDGSFVDILVRSEKSRESVWLFVEKHILKELYDFCASAKGRPGVTLVEDVLRTECVKQLMKCAYRKEQAISRELLKERLKRSIRDQGETGGDDSRNLFKYTWSAVADTSLGHECEAALDLLSPQDICDVQKWVGSETSALIERAEKSKDVLDQLCRTSSDSAITGVFRGESSVEKPLHDHMYLIAALADPDVRTLGNIIHELHETVVEKIDGLKVDIKQMSAQFAKAQKTAEDSFTQLFQHMDRLIGISNSSSQLPRRPFFTDKGASQSHRIKAKMNDGKPLILHFACENRAGNHAVVDQPGYELIVEGDRKWLGVILRNSVKVLWCLLKAGLHVSTSLGNIMPDLKLEVSDSEYTSLATLSIKSLVDILEPSSDLNSSNVVGSSPTAQKAWQCLLEHLKGKLRDKIPDHFKLYPAWYTDSETENLHAYAWLCKECRDAGIEDGRIRTSGSLFQ